MRNNINRKLYQKPEIEEIWLDNDISLIMQTNPGNDPNDPGGGGGGSDDW